MVRDPLTLRQVTSLPNEKHPSPQGPLFAAAAFVSLPWSVTGQPTAQTSADSAVSEPVIRLDSFQVSTEAVRGYATTSSLAGARAAVPIINTPASIIVINEKLIEDLAAENMADTFNLVSGMNQSGSVGAGLTTESNFSIRGYQSSGAMRDSLPEYQVTSVGGFSYTTIERIEIAKGPAGVLFGQHNAGGVVNLISKFPLPEPATKFTASVGSYNFWKVEADHSAFADTKRRLGYRVAMSTSDNDGELGLPGEPGRSWAFNPSVSYRMDNGLKLWAWMAAINDQSTRRINSTYAFGTAGGEGRVYSPMATTGRNSVVVNNQQGVRSDSFELGATKGFQWGPVTADARFVARYTDLNSDASRIRTTGTTRWFGANGNEIISTPASALGSEAGFYDRAVAGNLTYYTRTGLRLLPVQQFTEAWSYSADLNLAFNVGPTKHSMLLYLQHLDYWDSSPNYRVEISDVASLPTAVREELGIPLVNNRGYIINWPTPYPKVVTPDFMYEYSSINQLLNWPTLDRQSYNLGISDQISLLSDRLILVGGARYDRDNALSNPNAGSSASVAQELRDRNWTSRYGVVYKPFAGRGTGEVTLFYNNSETFVAVYDRDQRLSNKDERFPNRTVTTNEIGAKADLWGSRLVATLSYFDNVENNILVQGRDADGSVTGIPDRNYSFPGGQRTTKGFELDLSANPLPGLDLLLSFSDIDSMLSDGLPAFAVPAQTFSSVARYQFQRGRFKGFSVLWQYNRWGESYLNRSTPGFIIPPGGVHTAVLGYDWRNLSLRLRIENLEDDIEAMPSTWWTQVGVTEGLNARLSMTLRF
jgi:iron complex outermembrane receptor protein